MSRSFKRFYLTALFPLIFLSAYPVAMGTGIAVLSFQNGRILPEYYEQTVIPYAAVCSSILLTLLLYPLLSKLRRFSLPSATVFAAGLFLGLEYYMENITIHSPEALSAYKWQLESHIGSAEATQAFQMLYDNTYRIHYYITSLMLIVLVIGLIYSYENRIQSEEGGRKNLFRLQLIFTILFVVFCAFVNAASYLRKVSFLTEAVDYLISLSPTLTVFFNLVTAWPLAYMAGFLSGKRRLVSVFIPAAAYPDCRRHVLRGVQDAGRNSVSIWLYKGFPVAALYHRNCCRCICHTGLRGFNCPFYRNTLFFQQEGRKAIPFA